MNRSYWEEVLYGTAYDLIVVGAGITGQAAAYFYKKQNPDASVLILERGVFPIGASTRNAGFACIGTVGEHLTDLKLEKEETVKKRILARYNGLQLLRYVAGDEFIDFEATGGWEIYTNEAKFNENSTQIEKFNNWVENLTGEKEMYRAGSYNGYSAIFGRVEGMIHPGKLIKRLTSLNVASGNEFRWNSEVESINYEDGKVFLTDKTVFFGNKIVMAVNAFSPRLGLAEPVKPGRGYVFVTKPLQEITWKGTFHFNEGFVYFRNLGSDRILLGGGRNEDMEMEETDEFGVNSKVKDYLIRFADNILELPSGWKIEWEWSGIMGFTPTKSAHLKRVGNKGIIAAGLSGMGVALGMQLGKDAADLAEK